MHWTVGLLIGLLQHPLLFRLCWIISQNYFKLFSSSQGLPHHKQFVFMTMAPLARVSLKHVRCIVTVALWCMNLHYKFFGIGIPLLCLTVSWFLLFFLPHVMVCELFVVVGMQLRLHKYHRRFKVPASWTPRGGVFLFFLSDVGVSLLTGRCSATAWYIWSTTFSRSPSPNCRHVAYRLIHCDLVELTRESAMHCLQTFFVHVGT